MSTVFMDEYGLTSSPEQLKANKVIDNPRVQGASVTETYVAGSAVAFEAGILFVDFERQNRLRLNGVASVDVGDPLLTEYPGAQLVIRVHIREVFPNCPRYIHKLQRVEASPYVPRAGCTPPVPDWKRSDLARDVLPKGDPANE